MVRVGRVVVAVPELALVDHHGHQLENCRVDDFAQCVQERLARLFRKAGERPFLAPDVRFVQHHHVVAERRELDLPNDWRHHLCIFGLAENAERQHEHRVIRIDRRETVVTAFVYINYVVAVPFSRRE